MGETPHLPVISGYLANAHSQIERLREETNRLLADLHGLAATIVFVEGDSDRVVLEAAWDALIAEPRAFSFESAQGTTRMESLSRNGAVLTHLAPDRTILALVDNDREGRQLYKNKRLAPGARWVQHNSNGVWWCRLPFTSEMRSAFGRVGIAEVHWPGTLENLFSAAVRRQAAADNAYSLSVSPHAELIDQQMFPQIQPFVVDPARDESFYVLAPDPACKGRFAECISERATADPDCVEPLRPVLEGLRDVLEDIGAGE